MLITSTKYKNCYSCFPFHLFNKYLLSDQYASASVLATEDTAVNKMPQLIKNSALLEITSMSFRLLLKCNMKRDFPFISKLFLFYCDLHQEYYKNNVVSFLSNQFLYSSFRVHEKIIKTINRDKTFSFVFQTSFCSPYFHCFIANPWGQGTIHDLLVFVFQASSPNPGTFLMLNKLY